MLFDYAGTVGQASQPAPYFLMLIAECGMLAEIPEAVHAAATLLAKMPPPKQAGVQRARAAAVRAFQAIGASESLEERFSPRHFIRS